MEAEGGGSQVTNRLWCRLREPPRGLGGFSRGELRTSGSLKSSMPASNTCFRPLFICLAFCTCRPTQNLPQLRLFCWDCDRLRQTPANASS